MPLGKRIVVPPIRTSAPPLRRPAGRHRAMVIAGVPIKPATNTFGRPVVDLARRVELLQIAPRMTAIRDRHGHRFELVVGDVDHGLADPAVQLDQLGAHMGAELGIEVRERLVEKEDVAVRAPVPGRARRAAAGRRRAPWACATYSGSSCSRRATAATRAGSLGLGHAALLQRIGDVLRRRSYAG